MRKPILIILLFLILSPTATHAEKLTSPDGGQYVLMFKTKDTMDYFIKECAGKGSRIFANDCVSCISAMVTSGTRCAIIDKTMFTRKVRIMEGPHKGKVGWVPFEMVE